MPNNVFHFSDLADLWPVGCSQKHEAEAVAVGREAHQTQLERLIAKSNSPLRKTEC